MILAQKRQLQTRIYYNRILVFLHKKNAWFLGSLSIVGVKIFYRPGFKQITFSTEKPLEIQTNVCISRGFSLFFRSGLARRLAFGKLRKTLGSRYESGIFYRLIQRQPPLQVRELLLNKRFQHRPRLCKRSQ